MINRFLIVLIIIFTSGSLYAGNWYEDYNQALEEIGNRNWQAAVNLLNSAISQKREPKTRAKTYGLRFIDYLPYAYRGIAYFNLNKYDLARRDMEESRRLGEIQKAKKDKSAKQNVQKYLQLLDEKAKAPQSVSVVKKDEPEPQNTEENQTVKKRREIKNPPPKPVPETRTVSNSKTKSAKSSNRVYNKNITPTKNTAKAEDFDDAFEAALVLYNDGQFRKAKERFQELESKSPGKYDTQNYINRIHRVEKMVKDGITAYFEGDHDRSIAQLDSALKNNFVNADVHAFLGCAYAAKYLLQGASNNSLRSNAIEQFSIAKRLNPDYVWDQRYISPSIIDIFSQRN